MKKSFILEERQANDYLVTGEMQNSLRAIEAKIDEEIKAKQRTIERQEEEIRQLQLTARDKTEAVRQLNDKLTECVRNSEGSRQLINKLLGDIERLHQDIEWYKRTYEKRSLLGTMKEKLFGRKS